jgi:ABC-2 type transport system permease protein
MSPIHDQGYRRYGGQREPHGRRWWVITRAGILSRIREKRVIVVLLFAWAPFLIRAIQIYASANFEQVAFLAPTPEMFREFLDQQNIFIFIVCIIIGAGLIADDRRANALQIYLSKPLTRVEYIAGKLATLAIVLAFVTWLPAMLLLVLQMLFAGSTKFLREHLFLIPAITLFAATQVFVWSFAMLALSSLSKNRRFVAIMYAGILFFTAAMYQALRQITGSTAWAAISPRDTMNVIADGIFRIAGAPRPIPFAAAVLVVIALIVAAMLVLERRVRGVEVIT